MAVGFPPQPVYPAGIDSDYTLFLVYNTTEAALAADNDPWSEEIVIEPRGKTQSEIWADNGFANIEGELLYYDAVEKNANGKVYKLKRCARNLGGSQTKFHKAGTMVRSFVVAEHHNQLRNAIILTEQFIGENFSEDEETLDWRIRHLQAVPIIADDFGCPDINFHFQVKSSDPSTGTVVFYKLEIIGSYQEFVLSFGDGTQTSAIQEGEHTYPPNANIDPVVTFKNNNCQVVQTPISRDKSESPSPNQLDTQFDTPNFPDFFFPNISVTMPSFPEPDIFLPPFQFPCIDLSPFGISPIRLPSLILFQPSINLPSLIEFSPISFPDIDIPSIIGFGPISLPTIIEIIGPIPAIPSVIEVHVPQISFPSIIIPTPSFPDIDISVPSMPVISVVFPETIPGLSVIFPDPVPPIPVSVPPSVCLSICWDEPPALTVYWDEPPILNVEWSDPPPIFVDWYDPPPLYVNWGTVPYVYIDWSGYPSYIPISWGTVPSLPVYWGTVPYISVYWGTPPTVQVNVTVTCPSGAQLALTDPLGVDGLGKDLEVQYDVSGFPSEIRVIPPEIPDVRIVHDLPSEITVKSPVFPDVKFEVPEFKDIKILPPETQLTIEAIGIPDAIKLEPTLPIPDRIELAVPVRIPETITLDASGIPDVIRVEGLPDVIRLEHNLPASIKLEMPEKPEIELVYKGPPIPVQVELDIQKLIGDAENLQCVAIVPCPKK